MATAFTYSGTGLESAIQSGSGGIGTGASITLEVDAIPADVEQGDTVKVALGSASDWSGGNGETAYGDIGGAGANGGTNITLTDRGQEGTSAASWSEGDPVRVGVSGRDNVAPERSRILSQNFALGHPRTIAYGDFEGSDVANADGYAVATGQTLTVHTGAASIVNGMLKLEQDPTVVTLPVTNRDHTYRTRMAPNYPPNNNIGIIINRVSNGDYIRFMYNSNGKKANLEEKNSGSFTSLGSDNSREHWAHWEEFISRPNADFWRRVSCQTEFNTNGGVRTDQLSSSLQAQESVGWITDGGAPAYVDGFHVLAMPTA